MFKCQVKKSCKTVGSQIPDGAGIAWSDGRKNLSKERLYEVGKTL